MDRKVINLQYNLSSQLIHLSLMVLLETTPNKMNLVGKKVKQLYFGYKTFWNLARIESSVAKTTWTILLSSISDKRCKRMVTWSVKKSRKSSCWTWNCQCKVLWIPRESKVFSLNFFKFLPLIYTWQKQPNMIFLTRRKNHPFPKKVSFRGPCLTRSVLLWQRSAVSTN